MTRPLAGIRIVDLTTMISGPFATMLLGDQGADVFVQNFRPGVVARLGLGKEVARGLNPRLVYVSISGFGDKGSLAHKPAYDPIFQAASGLASVQGASDTARPRMVRAMLPDKIAALNAAQAISTALRRVDRSAGGGGCALQQHPYPPGSRPSPASRRERIARAIPPSQRRRRQTGARPCAIRSNADIVHLHAPDARPAHRRGVVRVGLLGTGDRGAQVGEGDCLSTRPAPSTPLEKSNQADGRTPWI